MEKGECFNFNHSLGSLPFSIHHHETSRSSLLFQPADLLPCLFYFHALIFAAFSSVNFLLLLTLRKIRKLKADLEKILAFNLALGDIVFLGKVCFDMLESRGFGDLVRLFSMFETI